MIPADNCQAQLCISLFPSEGGPVFCKVSFQQCKPQLSVPGSICMGRRSLDQGLQHVPVGFKGTALNLNAHSSDFGTVQRCVHILEVCLLGHRSALQAGRVFAIWCCCKNPTVTVLSN